MMQIVNVPDKILRQKSKSLDLIDQSIFDFSEGLANVLMHKTDPPGVGLSSVQVGKPIRMFATYMPKDLSIPSRNWSSRNMQIQIYINPELVDVSDEKTLGPKDRPSMEGCLSIPHLYGPVWRHEWVELEFRSIPSLNFEIPLRVTDLASETKRFSGFAARVIQHEYDHLEGILFTDLNQQSSLPLYFEHDGELKEIKDPGALLQCY